jgi:hypothetical protein
MKNATQTQKTDNAIEVNALITSNEKAFKSFNDKERADVSKKLASKSIIQALQTLNMTSKDLIRSQDGYIAINKKSFMRTLNLLESVGQNILTDKALTKHMLTLFVALHVQQKEVSKGEFKPMSETYMQNKEIRALVNKLSRTEDTSVQYAFKDALAVDETTITAKLGNDKYLLKMIGKRIENYRQAN